MKTLIKENKMGTMPVSKLLLSMSVPLMISMLVQALYNIVDSVFVARIGEEAMTALSLAFPIQNLMISISVGTSVGMNALLSKSLGEKNFDEANRAANNGIFLSVISYVLFLIFGLLMNNWFFSIQTNDPALIEFGTTYLAICSIFSLPLFIEIIFERILQSTGRTIVTMVTQTTGAVINIILDPILIFGLFGFPKMGVAGAAIATVFGQLVAAVMAIIFNHKLNHDIKIKVFGFRPNWNTIWKIYVVGLPAIVMTSISSIMAFCLNKILLAFSNAAIFVFISYFRIQSFIFMPVFGLNNGMVPIVAYNYGAQKKDRLVKTIKLSIIYAMGIMLVGFVLFQVFPAFFLSFFSPTQGAMEIGVPAMRIISLSFLSAGFNIICGSVFQAFGNGIYSMLVSIARQLIVLIPAAFLLSLTGDVTAVWWAFPIAEVASLTCTVLFLRNSYKKIILPMNKLSVLAIEN